jgi:hypothetical protein
MPRRVDQSHTSYWTKSNHSAAWVSVIMVKYERYTLFLRNSIVKKLIRLKHASSGLTSFTIVPCLILDSSKTISTYRKVYCHGGDLIRYLIYTH